MNKLIKQFDDWFDIPVYFPINEVNGLITNNGTVLLGVLISTVIIISLLII